jgi:hypothetical protein
MNTDEVIKRLDLMLENAYNKITQCQTLIDEYSKQKNYHQADIDHGQSLRMSLIGQAWEPPKIINRE